MRLCPVCTHTAPGKMLANHSRTVARGWQARNSNLPIGTAR